MHLTLKTNGFFVKLQTEYSTTVFHRRIFNRIFFWKMLTQTVWIIHLRVQDYKRECSMGFQVSIPSWIFWIVTNSKVKFSKDFCSEINISKWILSQLIGKFGLGVVFVRLIRVLVYGSELLQPYWRLVFSLAIWAKSQQVECLSCDSGLLTLKVVCMRCSSSFLTWAFSTLLSSESNYVKKLPHSS